MKKLRSCDFVKCLLTICCFVFFVISCSNDSLLSDSVDNDTKIFTTTKDGLGAVEISYDGQTFAAVKYEVKLTSLDKTVTFDDLQKVSGNSLVLSLPVAKYNIIIVGYDEQGKVVCKGSVTVTVDDDKDLHISVSLEKANDDTIVDTEVEGGFLFEKVNTLCVGDTTNTQVEVGDNWFGFIYNEVQSLYLSWFAVETTVQRVVVYKDGRDDKDAIYDSDNVGNLFDINNKVCSFVTGEGESCYYIRVVTSKKSDSFAISLSDSYQSVTTTTTVYVPVTTTSTSTTTTSSTTTTTITGSSTSTTSTTSSTTTTTVVHPTIKVATPSIAYDNSGIVSINCLTQGSVIYYTTDGSLPSLFSAKYQHSFIVTEGTTIKAIAMADGYLDSEIATFTVEVNVDIHIDIEEEQFDGIRILVAQNLGFDKIHYWNASNTTKYPNTTWPGVAMAKFDDSDYYYDFEGCSSVNLLITKSSGEKLCNTDIKIVAKGTYRVTSAGANNVTTGSSTTTSTTTTTTTVVSGNNDIILHCPADLEYTYIYAWTAQTAFAGTWPGSKMSDNDNDGYYDWTIKDKSSANVIFNNGQGGTAGNGQTADLSIASAGEYWYIGNKTGTGSSSDWTTVNPVAPTAPTYSISQTAFIGKTFTITVGSSVALTQSTVTIGGISKTLSIGKNTFSVSDFTSVPTTLSVSGILANEVGSISISGSISVTEAPEINNDFNNLRIYQVMVSSFQDGDTTRGYQYGYGPNGALRGGDLQGIINAADYISDLGCNAIWMTPIFDSSSGCNNEYLNSTGYFTYDYFNVDPKFGTNDTFRTLVETYHSKGIYVILDGVFGHWGEGGVKASPTGKTPTRTHGQYKACDYPASLEFFKEVATYWIKNYKIDGWRLDQCYQVGLGDNGTGENCYSNGHNYWYEIRKAVEEAAAQNAGDWGSLGYMVGEHWNGDATVIQKGSIDKGTAGGYGLQSCFDFPSRYKLVQSMAIEESKDVKNITFGEAIDYTMGTSDAKGYIHDEGYFPNLFVTNHDLVRFGNLINWACGESPTKNTDVYYGKHRVAIATLGAYTGPITIYYGDEWGAYVEGYNGSGDLGAYNDNVARSTGKISGFNSNEQSVIDFTKQVMTARATHEALWNGDNQTISSNGNLYVGKKTCGSQVIIYALNYSSTLQSFNASGTDLISGDSYSGVAKVAPYSAAYIEVR